MDGTVLGIDMVGEGLITDLATIGLGDPFIMVPPTLIIAEDGVADAIWAIEDADILELIVTGDL